MYYIYLFSLNGTHHSKHKHKTMNYKSQSCFPILTINCKDVSFVLVKYRDEQFCFITQFFKKLV